MPKKSYCFAAPISYASGNFRSVKLSDPFKIERWSHKKISDLISDMEGSTGWDPDPRVDRLCCVPEYGSTGHVVTAKIELEGDDAPGGFSALHSVLDSKVKDLNHQMQLISLFLSSPIMLSTSYWFEFDDGERVMAASYENDCPKDEHAFGLSYPSALSLNAFLAQARTRKMSDFVSIAFDHWNHSYDSVPKHMQLLSLITSLEVLLNPAQTELKHRVTRSAAVLLGSSREDGQHIYTDLGKIYDARSKVVHTGQHLAVKKVWFWQLRHWVSKSILYVMALQLPKEQLCRDLNQLGFGEGPEYISRCSL